jgi:hypothetical protein
MKIDAKEWTKTGQYQKALHNEKTMNYFYEKETMTVLTGAENI